MRWKGCHVMLEGFRFGSDVGLGSLLGWGGYHVGKDVRLERMPDWRGFWVWEDVSFGRIWVEQYVGLNN